MEFVRAFSQIGKNDTAIAGGKGASLGEMIQAGIPVPEGFVVLSSAFERFLEKADLNAEIDAVLHKVDHEKMHTVENASVNIRDLILTAKMSNDIGAEIRKHFKKLCAKYVAVRSSATSEDSKSAAWAGQLDTFLNTTEEHLLENVQKCWASLFTPRAIFYRFEKGMHGKEISVAVVVQKMVQSEMSGIAFSVHPVTEDHNQMIIEAGFGLGEAIVSGQITPDSYVVEKKPRRIIDKKRVASSQVLSDDQILEFSALILKVEERYGFPCDIEWAYESGTFYVVQSRPITTLKKQERNFPKYEKLFSRDFSLPSVEAWVRGESINPKGWTDQKQPFLPYIITERSDDTVHFWYDLEGVEWITDLLSKLAHEDSSFVSRIEKKVLEKLSYLRPIYEEERILTLSELKKFIKMLEDGYPWFEAMWWFCQMDEKKLVGLELENIKKVRALTNKLCNGSDTVIRKSLQSIYSQLGERASVLKNDEIISEKLPPIKELENRYTGYFFAADQLFVGKSKADVKNILGIRFETEAVASTNEIKGDVAEKGIAKGYVRRVMGHKQISEMREGEILVSPMTIPDFLPAMKKAAAIVTDEGGIICHAAIIARELKKPCIVGTKVATQLLKNGDKVEVDANQGIVRVLKRA